MKTIVEFRSDRFPPYESEDQQINPGKYRKRVAEFMADALKSTVFETDELRAENWGWIIPIKNEQFKLMICCGNYEEYANGFLCMIEPHTPFIRQWLRKIETGPRILALQQAMDKVLSACRDIREMRWWTHEEFDGLKT